jgi:receptor expression-enhancing protein 5/6
MGNWLEGLDEKLRLHDDSMFLTPLLAKAEDASKVRRLHLVIGVLGFISLYLIIGHAAELICNLIGFAYPAYQSIKAIESTNKDDDTKWLTYWVVCAAFHIVDFFSGLVLFWFPLYWLLKCIFLIWCYLPIENNGSIIIYYRFLRPFFLQNRAQIQGAVNDVINKAASTASKITKSN